MKKKQISFCIDAETAEQLKAAAMEEGIEEVGPFTRQLVKWAFPHYKKATCLFQLKKATVKFPQLKNIRRQE